MQHPITTIKAFIFNDYEFCKYNGNTQKLFLSLKRFFPLLLFNLAPPCIILTLWTQLILNFKIYLDFCTFRSSVRKPNKTNGKLKLHFCWFHLMNTWIVEVVNEVKPCYFMYYYHVKLIEYWNLFKILIRLYLQCKL